MIQVADRLYIFTDMRREIEGYVKILCYHIDENGDLKYEFEWGERPYVFMGYVRRDFDRKTVIVGAKTYTKYVGDYYVAFEPDVRLKTPRRKDKLPFLQQLPHQKCWEKELEEEKIIFSLRQHKRNCQFISVKEWNQFLKNREGGN